MRGIIAFGVRHPVPANLLMVCILIGGYVSASRMIRERYPEFSIDRIAVDIYYPGAGPADVEASLCVPIEEAITGIDGIRELFSVSSEGHGLVIAFLHEHADSAKVLDEIRVAVEQVDSLPPQAEKPIVREMKVRAGVINVAIHGDAPERTLKRLASEIKDDLADRGQVSQVTLWGVRDDEISIEVSENALRAYSLTFEQIMSLVAQSSLDLPAGSLRTTEEEFTLRVIGKRMTARDYEDLVVISQPDGTQTTLEQIAKIYEGFEEGEMEARFDGQPAAVVAIFKTPEQDTIEIARLVRDYVREKSGLMPQGVHLTYWADGSIAIDSRIKMLVNNGLMGIVLVFGCLALFLDVRVAFWVMVGIPVAYGGALLAMGWTDHTLNMISLFGLIMASGMIVDDAIVISENIHQRYRDGAEPELAVIGGASEVALAVVGSSATTIVAFIPLFYVVGVMGKFIRELPMVVIASLVASAVEAFITLPTHLYFHGEFTSARRSRSGFRSGEPEVRRWRRAIDGGLEGFTRKLYAPLLARALRHRWISFSLALAMLMGALGLVLGGRTPLVLLSKDDNDLIRVRVAFPEGTPIDHTRRFTRLLEERAWALNEDPALVPAKEGDLVRHVYSTIGFWNDFIPQRGNHLCEVKIELMEAGDRRIRDQVIMNRLRERVGHPSDALVFRVEPDVIAPTDRPIEIRLIAQDLEDLRDAADEVEERLAQFDGMLDVDDTMAPGKRELRVSLKPEAASLGVTLGDLATQLRQGFFGGQAMRLQREGEEVWVRVRYPRDERRYIQDLENVRIRTRTGTEIPFHEAANVEWKRGYASIEREAGMRRVYIFANIDERRANAERIVHQLEAEFLPDLMRRYEGMRYRLSGQRELIDESLDSLSKGYTLAMIGVYALLAAMLGSYFQPIIIMTGVPFGLIGAVAGHWIMGQDMTMMSLFGMVGLSGVAVNDTLVLVDYINGRLRAGCPVFEAVLESGQARLRAVLLTSVTTIAGLMPLLGETSGQAYTVIPMAISMSYGLIFSTVLTLLLTPVQFLLLNDARRVARWLIRGGRFPEAEAVEPAWSEPRPAREESS